MNKLIALCATLALSTQAQAQFWGHKTLTGNHQKKTETRKLETYDAVVVSGSFDVNLIPGKAGELRVSADANILPYILTEVSDKTLRIRFKSGYSFRNIRYLDITVPVEQLKRIELTGSGDIESHFTLANPSTKIVLSGSGDIDVTLHNDEIKAEVTGSGDLHLRGRSTDVDYLLTGSGDIEAAYLKAVNAKAEVTGSGDISLYCSKKLKARVTGSGDISYRGKPLEKDAKVTGSGEISQD